MQELALVRSRLKAVTGIRGVCSTLATVAAAKLSRTRDRAFGMRTYTQRLREIVARQLLTAREEGIDPAALSPLLTGRLVKRVMLLVIGTDQGLCGGYNLELDAELRRRIREWHADGVETSAIVRGERTARILRRDEAVEIVESTKWPRAGVIDDDVDRLLTATADAFTEGAVDEVWAVYAEHYSMIRRESRTVRLLPIDVREATGSVERYCYEHTREDVVAELLDVLVRLQIEDVMLEAFSAEQCARMITMQEATERADTALAELGVRYNRLRRESITADLTGVLAARRIRKEAANAS
ncbi:MAG: F0F1 ATP synthase subunit gamma [Coriobacteriales bacterium]|nr:F0F1 ATP synthase subunit gamma [Coriobacteriales bacterium]